MYNYNLFKSIRFTINDRPKVFEGLCESDLSLRNYHTRNSRFNLPLVRLDVERNFAIFQSIECFNVASAQLFVPMSDFAFKENYKRIVLESYRR